ncbi:hypothetical protein ANN_14753 [Periplaneta americana]|uniref:Uncharacterized protein n=1 Tax=Periplaneta americana TaxID=6978 RepID=A0ABQ8SYD8_PERAM|nr:hypothetical protein ANN_14753 [Periplaneta americana]
MHFIESGDVVAPRGWPLSLGSSGVSLQLGELDPTLLRNRDCYLCVRGSSGSPSVEVALVWKWEAVLSSRPLAVADCSLDSPLALEMAATDDLPGLLQSLLVSVERAIERVPLDALAFPCPRCHDDDSGVVCACQCVCQQQGQVEKRDTSIQTSPMFEFVGSIPHIDSDEENDASREPADCPDFVSRGVTFRDRIRSEDIGNQWEVEMTTDVQHYQGKWRNHLLRLNIVYQRDYCNTIHEDEEI